MSYISSIMETLKCSPEVAGKVEECMRSTIFHSTLDWQSPEEFDQGARDALAVLIELKEV